ncbi:MAG TPA: murein biosynthesis integral membrane protein MurJ [Acidobacteriota bacterium]|nr:murein biosynthesis integral membrane protein MurJ [Acidobacteriota bacterium]
MSSQSEKDPQPARGNGQRGEAARAAGLVSLAVLCSRILGLVREMVFSRLLGASLAMDALRVAFLIPNLLRDLFAEGALSSAFVPTFTDYLRNKSRSEAWHLAGLVMSLLMMVLSAFALLLLAFPRQAMLLAAAGFADDPEKARLTAFLLQILSPFLLFVALASVAMGILNALGHYFLPALAPAFFNLAVIVSGFTLAPYLESQGYNPAAGLALGMLAGGVLQFAVQVPLMRRNGFRFRPGLDLNHPGIRRILRLMGPAVVGISAVQANVLISMQMASYLEPSDGVVSWLGYAFRIIYLPIGMFGVAVGTVNLRNVSLLAAEGRQQEVRANVCHSLRLVTLLALPSMAGMLLLAEPLVRLLYEGGRFSAESTYATALALMVYAVALPAYSCQKVYVPTFYALDDTRTPVRISILSVAVNVVFSLTLVFLVLQPVAPRSAYLGLALGTGVSISLQVGLLARALRIRLGSMRAQLAPALARMAGATAVMTIGVYLLHSALGEWLSGSRWSQALLLAACIAGGGALYFACCLVLGVEEVKELTAGLRNRLSGRGRGASRQEGDK